MDISYVLTESRELKRSYERERSRGREGRGRADGALSTLGRCRTGPRRAASREPCWEESRAVAFRARKQTKSQDLAVRKGYTSGARASPECRRKPAVGNAHRNPPQQHLAFHISSPAPPPPSPLAIQPSYPQRKPFARIRFKSRSLAPGHDNNLPGAHLPEVAKHEDPSRRAGISVFMSIFPFGRGA